MNSIQYDASLLLILTVLYFAVQAYASTQYAKKRVVSDDEYLSCLAMVRQCSAYDVFRLAGDVWNFSNSKIESDFGSYLRNGGIPHYVATFAKKNVQPDDLQVHASLMKRW